MVDMGLRGVIDDDCPDGTVFIVNVDLLDTAVLVIVIRFPWLLCGEVSIIFILSLYC